ncbi:uncharacterized protein I303_101646 [Kwoniella dejecticola CBS 10117]|uniref:Uncharacterized protein n=1 Tax=Kwoniella dejecticola CBS 10117 TaxID=1296121 RepID=A0A1A6AD61_9TREE|nr:uncharacterized protein I303_02218 [Kwoniella dejecticola CBS 10117]OBR88002.1 hypothetical protein I303_02218 [Kwoniella dejecticola CBS 10117]
MPPKAIYQVFQERTLPISSWDPAGGNEIWVDVMETCSTYKAAKQYIKDFFEGQWDERYFWVDTDDEKDGHSEIKAQFDEEDMRLWSAKEAAAPSAKATSAQKATAKGRTKTTSVAAPTPKSLAVGSKRPTQTARKQTANSTEDRKALLSTATTQREGSTSQTTAKGKGKGTPRQSLADPILGNIQKTGNQGNVGLGDGTSVHLLMEEHIYPRKRKNNVVAVHNSFDLAKRADRRFIAEGGFGDANMWNNYQMMDTDKGFEMKADGAKGVHHKIWIESHAVKSQ